METAEQGQPILAVVYAAKSTQDKHKSIPTQLEDCRQMAAENEWEVVGEYQDEGFSAYSKSRGPGLAEAREHAARIAAECGETVMLVAQHSDRFSRGAGDKPRAPDALIEIWHAERRRDVHLRSVQDDFDLRTSASVANMGERNYADSKRKAQATADGRRRAAERGEAPGSVPDGYVVERGATGATIVRRVVIDPERREVYRLLWDLALNGATVNAIVRELAAHRYLTVPHRAEPKPFDATRVGKVLVNPFYAGLMVSRGKIIGAGNWVAYIEPDDWHRLRRERSERARYRPEPVGRPPGGLLARLARCPCGSVMTQQRGGPRKDGSRKRTYTCVTHMHRRDDCSMTPFDAEIVERMVLDGLDDLLGQVGVWSKALLAARDAQRGRLTAEAEAASVEVAACEAAIEQLSAKYDAAVIAGDEAEIALAKQAWVRRRQTAERAELRQQAATDALGAEDLQPEEDADLALARLCEALSSRLSAAKGDVQAINAVLRDHFDAMHLAVGADGQLSITPVLSASAVEGIWRETSYLQHVGDDGQAEDTPWPVSEHRHWSYAPEPDDPKHYVMAPKAPVLVSAGNMRRDSSVSRPAALTAETSDQRGKQRLSHQPHNTRPGSSRGTAGGSPRRNRRGGRDRPLRSRS